jgi:hypothetical protein
VHENEAVPNSPCVDIESRITRKIRILSWPQRSPEKYVMTVKTAAGTTEKIIAADMIMYAEKKKVREETSKADTKTKQRGHYRGS